MSAPLPTRAAQAALAVLQQRGLATPSDLQRLQTLANRLSALDHKLAVTEALPLLFGADTPAANAETSLRKLVMRLNDVQADADIPETLRLRLEVQRKNQALSHHLWFTGTVGNLAEARTHDLEGAGPRYASPALPPQLLGQSAPGHEPVLLITVNDNETAALRQVFQSLGPTQTFERDGYPYELLGYADQRPLIAFRSQMGSVRVGAALQRTLKAIAHHRPSAVIALGIAFGRNDGKQQLGDVLLSSQVQTYESERHNENGSHTWRGEKVPAASRWLERCTQHPPQGFKLHKGLLVCGEKLLDNAAFREHLNQEFPTHIGGDMESTGLVTACHDEKVDWVVVKGTSDWGDGTKATGSDEDKQALQQRAATHAALVAYSAIFLEAAPASNPWAEPPKHLKTAVLPATARTQDLDNIRHLIEQLPTAQSMGQKPPAAANQAPSVREALLLWLQDDKAPAVFALLGEYGMGKTINCQGLYKDLRDLRQQANPPTWAREPLYFDLRNLTLFADHDPKAVVPLPTTQALIDNLITRGWFTAPGQALPRFADVQTLLAQGALLIIDGLDECLVHLTEKQHPNFVNGLLTLLTDAEADAANGVRLPRLLLSCRTNFFKTLADQRNLFTGQHRGKVGADWYQALLLTPLTETQITQYLAAVLPGLESARALDLIATTHNLPELAQRPMTLKLLSEHLSSLEALRMQGKTVNGAALYSLVATQWLERDFGKHHLEPEFKLRLMAALAAHIWKSKVRSLGYQALHTWFHQWRETQPDLAQRYAPAAYNQIKLEEDLRTATFVVRQDGDGEQQAEGFRFAHSSLAEFFLARYLADAVMANLPEHWALPIPSAETLHFLGELLALDQERLKLEQPIAPSLQTTLNTWRTAYRPQASELMLKYALIGKPGDLAPRPLLAGFVLTGAELSEWVFGNPIQPPDQPLLPMQACDFSSAQLRAAQFHHVRLDGSRFDGAVLDVAAFQHCSATGTQWQKASLVGTVLRQCDLRQAEWEPEGKRYRVQVVGCKDTQSEASLRLQGASPPPPGVSDAQLTFMNGHRRDGDRSRTYSINSVAFSRHGSRLASGSDDATVRLWDASTGELLQTLAGHQFVVTGVAWSYDDSRIASSSRDGMVRIWDAAAGLMLHSLTSQDGWFTCVAFSSDGNIAAGSTNGSVWLWNVATGQLLHRLTGHSNEISSVAFSIDGASIASGSHDHTVRLWCTATGRLQQTMVGHSNRVTSVGFTSDGACIVSGSSDRTVRIWNAGTGRWLNNLTEHDIGVNSLAFSGYGSRIASSDGNTVRVFDITTGQWLLSILSSQAPVKCVAFSNSSTHIAYGDDDGSVWLRDGINGRPLHTLTQQDFGVNSVAFARDGACIASCSKGKTQRLWDIATGELLNTFSRLDLLVTSIEYTAHGAYTVSGTRFNTILVWDTGTGKLLRTLTGHQAGLTGIALSADGTRIASSSFDRTVRIWNIETGQLLHILKNHGDGATSVAFSHDGTHVVSGSRDKTVRVWNTKTGQLQRALLGVEDAVTSVAFLGNSMRIAAGSLDATVRLWDITTGQLLHTLTGHDNWVTSVSSSGDGSLVASGSYDNTVRIWDVTSGMLVRVLKGHSDWVNSVAFSQDGKHIISGSDDTTLRLWDAATGQQLRAHWAGTLGTVPSHATWRPPATETGLPEFDKSPATDGGALLSASGDAWRMLAWRIWDHPSAPGQWTQLPLDVYD